MQHSGENVALKDVAEIRELIAAINKAWSEGPLDAIAGTIQLHLDDDVIFRGPGFVELARGAEQCARSYETFVREAQVLAYAATEAAIDVTGESVIATYLWSMTYALGGTEYVESGYDIYAVARRDGKWRLVWRAMLPQETPPADPPTDGWS